jgi:hypothetical protein
VSEGPASLSGDWTGVYDYSNTPAEAVAFNAALTDVGGVIWGVTVEPNSFSPVAETTLSAAISGSRSGREVRFRKEYDHGIPGGEDPVHYRGTLTSDGMRIEGEWRILVPGQAFGGPFVMNRLRGAKAEQTRAATAEESVDR